MKGWRVVKITLAAVLVLANVFMLGFLYSVSRPADYLPEEAIRQARELLRKDGIVISQGVVDAKKVNLPIYEGTLSRDYHAAVASKLSGSGVSLSFDAPNGAVISMANGDRCTFSDEFGIRYVAAGSPEILISSAQDVSALSSISPEEEEGVKKTVSAFLGRAGNESAERGQNALFSYTFVSSGRDSTNDVIYCVCEQTVDQRTFVEFQSIFAVYDGRVIGMSGSWCFASTDGIYSAQLLDQINILYSVRNRILEERDDATNSRVEIVSLELGYAVYFRSDTESFYLIPAWNVQMDSGKIYSVNAVDGTLYTK